MVVQAVSWNGRSHARVQPVYDPGTNTALCASRNCNFAGDQPPLVRGVLYGSFDIILRLFETV